LLTSKLAERTYLRPVVTLSPDRHVTDPSQKVGTLMAIARAGAKR